MTGEPFSADIPSALSNAIGHMRAAGVPDPVRDARILLARAIDQPIDRLALFTQGTMSDRQARRFADDVRRRVNREPISLITGRKDFYGRSFAVGPAVLAPRPETECLIELALAERFERVLDLGTGSGCILFTLLLEQRTPAWGVGVEKCPDALMVAMENRDDFDLAVPPVLHRGDWYSGIENALPDGFPSFNLIVSNPPYIAASEMAGLEPEVRDHEPDIALTDGADGLSAYREIVSGAPKYLIPGGRILVEIGHMQADAVTGIFRAAGLHDIAVNPDLDGRDRVVSARA